MDGPLPGPDGREAGGSSPLIRRKWDGEKNSVGWAISDINVTPMVDVMLVLLIIFMVVTPMLSKGVSVDKVKAMNPIAMQAADKEDAVLVSVTATAAFSSAARRLRRRSFRAKSRTC